MKREADERRVARLAGRCIEDYRLIEAGDRVLVALSGGKDSWVLLHTLEALRRRAPVSFSVEAVTVDPGSANLATAPIEEYCRRQGFTLHVEGTHIFENVRRHLEPGTSFCALCARYRRGVLYRLAGERGATKIALGHHREDLVETLLLNLFFSGKLASMPPLLRSLDGQRTVIRPLAYVPEDLLASCAAGLGVPVVDCRCPLPEGRAKQRDRMKSLLAEMERLHPQSLESALAALANVKAPFLLDRRLSGEEVAEEEF